MTRLSADERRVLVERLLDQRRTAGLPAEVVSRSAKQVGIAERTLWRWLAGPCRARMLDPATHSPKLIELPTQWLAET